MLFASAYHAPPAELFSRLSHFALSARNESPQLFVLAPQNRSLHGLSILHVLEHLLTEMMFGDGAYLQELLEDVKHRLVSPCGERSREMVETRQVQPGMPQEFLDVLPVRLI